MKYLEWTKRHQKLKSKSNTENLLSSFIQIRTEPLELLMHLKVCPLFIHAAENITYDERWSLGVRNFAWPEWLSQKWLCCGESWTYCIIYVYEVWSKGKLCQTIVLPSTANYSSVRILWKQARIWIGANQNWPCCILHRSPSYKLPHSPLFLRVIN